MAWGLGARLVGLLCGVLALAPVPSWGQQTLRGVPLIRSGRKIVLPDHSHGFMDTIPQEFGRILREFLG